jgi:hypothetical protein
MCCSWQLRINLSFGLGIIVNQSSSPQTKLRNARSLTQIPILIFGKQAELKINAFEQL